MRLSKPMFWLLTLLWFAAAIWWYGSCSKCSTCNAVAPPPLPGNIALPGFSVSDSSWGLNSSDNLRFGKSGQSPVLGTGITSILDSVAVYAKNHPGKKITVTGYYSAEEKNSSSFADLGLARADEIKKWLISKGVSEKNIVTNSVMQEALVFSPADTLVGGIGLQFANTVAAPEPVAAVKDDLFGPHTVYFNTGKNTLPVDPVFTSYIEKAKAYLQNHADKKLVITGHTDNVGDAEKNKQLSAGRAAFVKDELVKKGIGANRMESVGKGMDEPIADNTTAEGRAKNRRVTIQLQ